MTIKIFVCHAAADEAVATKFKTEVQQHFLNVVRIFSASNLDSINAGQLWIDEIKGNITTCDIIVGLLSPVSLRRGWVYFEFGAGWARSIPVIPLCHSGLDPGALPQPLSIFQGLSISRPEHWRHLYELFARTAECGVPAINFQDHAASYHEMTELARISSLVEGWIRQLIQWNPGFIDLIRTPEARVEILVPSNLDAQFREFVLLARGRGVLNIEGAGMAFGTRVGPNASVFTASRGPRFAEIEQLFQGPDNAAS